MTSRNDGRNPKEERGSSINYAGGAVVLLRPEAAAAWLGVRPATLAKWRVQGGGPPFRKLSLRCVRYAVADLERWLEQRTRASTARDPAA